jgi:hypothetical protein
VVREEGIGEATPYITPKCKGTIGEEYDTRINRLFNILNGLAKGQKAIMDLMGQFVRNLLEGTTKKNQNGDGG